MPSIAAKSQTGLTPENSSIKNLHLPPQQNAVAANPRSSFFLRTQRTLGNRAVQRLLGAYLIQAKLTISEPGDDYEQEADRVADTVMRMPDSTAAGYEQEADRVSQQLMRMPEPAVAPQLSSTSSERVDLQRTCAYGGRCSDCQSEGMDEPEQLQMKNVDSNSLAQITVPSSVQKVLGSPGQPLDPSTRAFMQSRFGRDFSQVRLHTDATAGESARALHARAYTVGRNVVFAPQEYAPATAEGRRLLAHELTHTIQQSRSGSHAIPAALDWTAPVALSSAPDVLQRKEAVLAPSVTLENPLERLLKGEPDGLTTPFVNEVQISDTATLDDALPSSLNYTAGSGANTCKVGSPIDINSKAKIIAASAPGPKGWTASVPFATVNKVLKITDKSCAARKGDINVRMVAKIGNEAYAKLVRTAEGDHEAVLKENHKKYLKPYHDLVNSKEGSNKDLRKCAEGLAKEFREKEVDAINNWAKDWIASVDKLDGEGGPHTSKASRTVADKCDEVLVTIKR